MTGFVKNPNLPERAETILVGEKYSALLEKPLRDLGLSPLFVPDNRQVDERLSGHADLSVFHMGGDRLYLAPQLRLSAFAVGLEALGARLFYPAGEQGSAYPQDAALNACAFGGKLIYSKRVTAPEIAEGFDGTLIHSRQGYAGCSVCPVDDNSIICSDAGIARAAGARGIAVLLVTNQGLSLPGFDCGFIGGSAFMIARDTLAFTGSLNMYPDRDRILAFLAERGIQPVYLTERNIFDIGGGIALTEK